MPIQNLQAHASLALLASCWLCGCTLDTEGTSELFAPTPDAGGVVTDAGGGQDRVTEGSMPEDASEPLPEAGQPDATQPDASQPDATEPDVTTPDAVAECLDSDQDGVCDADDICPGGDDNIDGDGDDVPDACDPCPNDNPDDQDGDLVCDSVDACPGSDDALDEDGDGIPDGCDPCPIDGPNAQPLPLPASGSGITISDASINGGSNIAVVTTGQQFSLTLDYSITDCGCETCRDEIEVGFVPGSGHSYCAYTGVPGCDGDDGTNTSTVTAPMQPGVYDIRFGQRQDYVCGTTWWHGEPPSDRTVAKICVQ